MNTQHVALSYEVHEDLSELNSKEIELLRKAGEAAKNAYSPYSQFSVGAALILDNDEIVLGNNQENGAYPSGLCAERVAFFWKGANRKDSIIRMVAIRADSALIDTSHPIAPCGACRQVMLEYELNQQEEIVLLMQGSAGVIYKMKGIKNLLPLYFNEAGLKK
jgi:cytidine deaminase